MNFTTCTFNVYFRQAGFNVCLKRKRKRKRKVVNLAASEASEVFFMPFAAPRPCSYAGCGVLVRDGSGRCQSHKHLERKQLDARRGTAHERGYTGAWQKARAGFLRSHPLCAKHAAKGETVAASVVDHIVPHKGNMTLFWLLEI